MKKKNKKVMTDNLIKWPLMKDAITPEDRLELVNFILNSDRYTNGREVKRFEQAWANWIGSDYALMVSSGSTANFLIVAAIMEKYRLPRGSKVLLPACTWVTSVSPFIQLGFEPIFCDINLKNFSFDLEHLKEIKKVHPDIAVIHVTHLLGFPAENSLYQEMFPDAIVLDDVCESHGCLDKYGRVGSNSVAASFSFYFGHHMTTIEGGVITTNDSELYDLMKMKRSHGLARESVRSDYWANMYPDIDPQFLFVTDGYNFRSTELNAVLGLSQITRLDDAINIRKNNFYEFTEIVKDHLDKFEPIYYTPYNSNFAFPFICHTREIMLKMKSAFKNAGIEYRPIVGGNLLRQPFLRGYDFGTPRKNSNADLLNDNGVYIGNSHFVTAKDMNWLRTIVESI